MEIPSSTTQLMILGHPFVFTDGNEYENMKKENLYLKTRVSELEHNVYQQNNETIEELKRENEKLRKKIELLENELAEHRTKLMEQNARITEQNARITEQNARITEQNARIMILENKDFVQKLIIGLQDLNSYY